MLLKVKLAFIIHFSFKSSPFHHDHTHLLSYVRSSSLSMAECGTLPYSQPCCLWNIPLLGIHFSTQGPSDASTQAVGPDLDLLEGHLIHQGSSEVKSPPLHCDPAGTGCGAMDSQTHPCGYVLPTPGGANHPIAQIPHKVDLYRKGDSHCESIPPTTLK